MKKILPFIIILALTPSASAYEVTDNIVSESGTVAELVHTPPNRIEVIIRLPKKRRLKLLDQFTYCAFNQPDNKAITARTMARVEEKVDPPVIEITEVVTDKTRIEKLMNGSLQQASLSDLHAGCNINYEYIEFPSLYAEELDPLKKLLILDNEQLTQKQSNRLIILDQRCENN